MPDDALAFTPAARLRDLIARKEASPVELVRLFLDRIDRLDGPIHAYLTVLHDEALETARAAETAVMSGAPLGPLHGVPISVKDIELTRGVRTTAGSLMFRDRVPVEDSVVVERLRQAGAIILGKTNTPEFGLAGSTENRLGDPCRNPWDTERTPGGSSGGAGAAQAAGLCALSSGTDAGGSIRIPSSYCGVYGIKPTQGRVPRYGGAAAPLVANQIAQSGPMSRTVEDAAIMLQVMAGHDPRDLFSLHEPAPDLTSRLNRDLHGLRVGWTPDFGYGVVDPEVMEITRSAMNVVAGLGCDVADADVILDRPFEAFLTIFTANTYAGNMAALAEHSDELNDYARMALAKGASVTGAEYARALGYMERLRADFARLFERFDLLLSPTMPTTAFPIGQRPWCIKDEAVHPLWGFLPFSFPINLAGCPAANVPCGFSQAGLPVGLQIIGPRGGDDLVLAASAAFERAQPWAAARPAGY